MPKDSSVTKNKPRDTKLSEFLPPEVTRIRGLVVPGFKGRVKDLKESSYCAPPGKKYLKKKPIEKRN